MSQFEYLSVLVSIIIGLAITQLLSGAARLIQLRRRVRPHAATLCWMVSLFLANTQIWWASFERREREDWNFFLFLLYLLMPILAFLLSYLVLPELGDEDEIDLAANFADNHTWFFLLLALLPTVSLVDELLETRTLPRDSDAIFRLVLLAFALIAGRIRGRHLDLWIALVGLALTCVYVATQFLELLH